MPDLNYKKGAEQSAPFLFSFAIFYLDGRE
jgi:hypothetical protein